MKKIISDREHWASLDYDPILKYKTIHTTTTTEWYYNFYKNYENGINNGKNNEYEDDNYQDENQTTTGAKCVA